MGNIAGGHERRVRPLLADWGETSLFLAGRGVTLNQVSRDLFLDYLYADFAAALRLLIRRAKGDYSPDNRANQFPKFVHTPDPGLSPWMLFERWIAAVKPARSTIDRWRAVFLRLSDDFPAQNAASCTSEQARAWLFGCSWRALLSLVIDQMSKVEIGLLVIWMVVCWIAFEVDKIRDASGKSSRDQYAKVIKQIDEGEAVEPKHSAPSKSGDFGAQPANVLRLRRICRQGELAVAMERLAASKR